MVYILIDRKEKDAYSSKGTIEIEDDEKSLFVKYHHVPTSTLEIDNILVYYQDKLVTLKLEDPYKEEPLTDAYVFFNRYQRTYPLVLLLKFRKNKDKYYNYSEFKNDIGNSKVITGLPDYNESEILDVFIKENCVTNKEITYQIDKTDNGYSDRIQVETERKEPSNGFTKYTHKPKNSEKKSSILYDNHLLNGLKDGKLEPINEIQNTEYSEIHVYFSDKINKPLLVCLINGHKQCYQHKKSNGKNYFQILDNGYDQLIHNQKTKLKETLKSAEFHLLNTVVILIEKQKSYDKQEVSHNNAIANDPSETQPETINVSENKTCSVPRQINCILYQHDLSTLSTLEEKIELKLLIYANSKYNEINLYNNSNIIENNRDYMYYQKDYTDFNVYFYGGVDRRPLLLIHGKSTYRPSTLKEYTSNWIKVDRLIYKICDYNDPNFKPEIVTILDMLNQVDISKTQKYSVHHEYPEIEIKVARNGLKCYYMYTHTPNSGYKLGKIVYNKDRNEYNTNINETKEKKSVVVYYYNKDDDHTYPLMIEIELNGTSKTKTYYKLKDKNSYQFERIKETNLSESDLLNKLFDINKEVNSDKNPQESECKDIDKIPTIVGATVPTVGITGGGAIAAYFFRETILTFFKSLM